MTNDSAILSEDEKQAALWYANQQVEEALKEGTISEEQAENHWTQSAADLLDEPELLAKVVVAHKAGKENAMMVVFKHYGMLDNLPDNQPPTASEVESLMSAKRNSRRFATVAVALALSSPLQPPIQANGMGSGSQPIPVRREDIPLPPPVKPVKEGGWTGREGDRKPDEDTPLPPR